jgi:hypothetical protein
MQLDVAADRLADSVGEGVRNKQEDIAKAT